MLDYWSSTFTKADGLAFVLFLELMAPSSKNQIITMSPTQSTHTDDLELPEVMYFEEPPLSNFSATTRAAVVAATG